MVTILDTENKITLALPRISDDPAVYDDRFNALSPGLLADDSELAVSNALLKDVNAAKKEIEAAFDEPVKAAHEAHTFLTGQRGALCKPYVDLDGKLRVKIGNYLAEKERLANIERERQIAAERARQEEEARAQAEVLEAAGHTEEALAVLDAAKDHPVILAAPAAPVSKEAMGGNSSRKKYDFEVNDLLALVRAAASNPAAYLQYLMPNEKAIRAMVGAQKAAAAIPGVKITEKRAVTLR